MRCCALVRVSPVQHELLAGQILVGSPSCRLVLLPSRELTPPVLPEGVGVADGSTGSGGSVVGRVDGGQELEEAGQERGECAELTVRGGVAARRDLPASACRSPTNLYAPSPRCVITPCLASRCRFVLGAGCRGACLVRHRRPVNHGAVLLEGQSRWRHTAAAAAQTTPSQWLLHKVPRVG